MSGPYDDIINLPRPVSKHPQMSMHDRAAQFSPFAALVGSEDAVGKTARLTEQRRELDEQEQTELNRRLALLESKRPEHPGSMAEYFVPDRDAGGTYDTLTGTVAKISSTECSMPMQTGQPILIRDILSVKGKNMDPEDC